MVKQQSEVSNYHQTAFMQDQEGVDVSFPQQEEVKKPEKKNNIQTLLIIFGGIFVVLLFLVIVIAQTLSQPIEEVELSPSPTPQTQRELGEFEQQIVDMRKAVKTADPALNELPFPPVANDLFMSGEDKR